MARLFALLALAAAAAPTAAQVFKCVDAQGHVTYQEAPCTAGQKGGAVELKDPVSAPAAPAANWSIPSREGRVLVGMPKTFVTEAIGKPAEIRAPRSGETGTEVWVYPRAGQVMRVGFNNNAVAWMRTDSAQPDASTGAAVGGDRESRVREALKVGRPCATVLQEAGPADREEPLVAGATTGARYVYALDAKDANAYAAFVCLGGRVTSVERYMPERVSDPRAGTAPGTPTR